MALPSGFKRFARSSKWTVGLVSVKKTRHIPGTMNRAEDAFAKELDARMDAGAVIKWEFENWTVRLSDDCRYTPDFRCVVCETDGTKVVVFYEVKAQRKSKRTDKETGVVGESRKPFWEDDA